MTSAAGRPRAEIAPRLGLGVAVVLVVAAIAAPPLLHWNVWVATFPPLLADLRPHVGPGTIPSVVVAGVTIAFAHRAAVRSRWWLLLLLTFAVGLAWILSLATVDGLHGISRVFDNPAEYLDAARSVTDIDDMLRGFVARIPATAPDHWPVSVAGHPPAAFLFFVLLVRLGLGSGLAAGLVVVVIAATTPAAVLITVRRLGSEQVGRRVAPFLAVGPAAIWLGVTADAMFAAVAAWGLCCLAVAATSRRRAVRLTVAVVAGLLLGICVFLSYGLLLLGVLALAVLLIARSWRLLPVVLAGAGAVALTFAALGFAWWEAYPVLVARYWAGIAVRRPGLYWVWADLAVLAFVLGPAGSAAVGAVLARIRAVRRPGPGDVPVLLALAAVVIIVAADLSGLSRSEVERIWLPFVPWLLLGTAVLPPRWRRGGLAANVVTGLVIEHLLHTAW